MRDQIRPNRNHAGLRNPVVIVCEPGCGPVLQPVALSSKSEEVGKALRGIVGGPLECIPYPRQLGRDGLVVLVGEEAIQRRLPYNRWGLFGTFVVVGQDGDGLQSVADPASVLRDLGTSYGYMDPASGVATVYQQRLGFFSQRALRVDDFVRQGGAWEPDLHFTGEHRQPEIMFLNWLLQRYAEHLVAYSLSAVAPGMYSVELQFGASEADRQAMSECRRLYLDAFDDEGVLKPERAEKPPQVG